MVGIWAWKFFSWWVQMMFWYYSLLLHSIKITSHRTYWPIFFVVWVLVLILGKVRSSAIFSSIPLVNHQVSKNTLILALLYSQLQPVIRGLFRRFGYRLTSFFQENTTKIKFGIFETLRGHIFDHIGSAQKPNFLHFPYQLPIRKYAWNTLQNQFFCQFSKTSEKTAYLQKKVCQNPPRR